ncbi:7965_t:CDS:1, partial [Gigaspora rosea]
PPKADMMVDKLKSYQDQARNIMAEKELANDFLLGSSTVYKCRGLGPIMNPRIGLYLDSLRHAKNNIN